MRDVASTPEEYFSRSPAGLALYRAVADAVAVLGPADVRVTRSQIAFRRRKAFAFVWRPGQYVRNPVPAVLSIALPHAVTSSRFKEVAHPAPGVWMHHLELDAPAQLDEEVKGWLRAAYAEAG
jgi:hypothetical protein